MSSGRSVDVTFTAVQTASAPPERQVSGLCLADMGTDFDDFSPRATAFATQGRLVADAQAEPGRGCAMPMNYGAADRVLG